jgi:MFS family permease
VVVVSIIGILWSVAMFAWFFLCALYLQLILGFTPLHVGLAFLPANLIMAAFSLGLSAKMVMRYGTRRPMIVGMLCIAAGLALFALAPAAGGFNTFILPGMLLMGLGAGMAFNPVLLAGMDGIPDDEAGLVSGVLNTAFMMGGALGLAVLASLAAYRTEGLLAQGIDSTAALLGGYHTAFVVGAIFAALAAGAAFLTRDVRSSEAPEH